MWENQCSYDTAKLELTYYSDETQTVTVASAPESTGEHRKYFFMKATLGTQMNVGQEFCTICMNVGNPDTMMVGDRGIGGCVDATASIDEVVTVEAVSSKEVRPSPDNGWDATKSTVVKSGAEYTLSLVSLDLNDEGKNAWLGLRSQDN